MSESDVTTIIVEDIQAAGVQVTLQLCRPQADSTKVLTSCCKGSMDTNVNCMVLPRYADFQIELCHTCDDRE